MERIITVKGRGKISVAPDTIRLNINAEGVFKEYEETLKKSADETNTVRKTISKAGIDPKNLKTSYFNVDTQYGIKVNARTKERKNVLTGYKYTHEMTIKFPVDNELLGKVLYELAHCPVKVEFSINHTVKDLEAVKNELLAKAVTDSKNKAEKLSGAAGVKLGNIVRIDYSWGEIEVYSRPVRNGSLILGDCVAYDLAEKYDIDIEAEEIDVEDTVAVVWEIV